MPEPEKSHTHHIGHYLSRLKPRFLKKKGRREKGAQIQSVQAQVDELLNLSHHHPESGASGPSSDGRPDSNADDLVLDRLTYNPLWDSLKTAFQELGKLSEPFPPLKTVSTQAVAVIDRVKITEEVDCDFTSLQANLDIVLGILESHVASSSPLIRKAVGELARATEGRFANVQEKLDGWAHRKMWEADGDLNTVENQFEGIEQDLRGFRMDIELATSEAEVQPLNTALLDSLGSVGDAEFGNWNRVQCMHGTRVEVLGRLMSWAEDPNDKAVFWLNGMAGTGKTTISESFALALASKKLLGASFFCSRDLPDRRDVRRILPTLAYRLAHEIPDFCEALYGAIEASSNIAYRELDYQYANLIAEPIRNAPTRKIVVIDAIDECEDVDLIQQLLKILLDRSEDHSIKLKFLVSCRPVECVWDAFRDNDNLYTALQLHDVDGRVVSDDIKHYMKSRLASMQRLQGAYGDLLEGKIDDLAKRTGNVFLYASTLCNFIRQNNADPRKRFQLLLDAIPTLAAASLDNLYDLIMRIAFDGLNANDVEGVREVVAAIVSVQVPLSIRDYATLLGVTQEAVRGAVLALASVIQVRESNGDSAITVYHSSFAEYLTDIKRCRDTQWRVDISQAHCDLARRCLRLLNSFLEFNIAQVVDSHRSNKDQKENTALPTRLTYSCQFWAYHLALASSSSPPFDEAEELLLDRLPFWLEVMSVLGKINDAEAMLRKLGDIVSLPPSLRTLVKESWDFIVIYAQPLIDSAPHIYLSALSWECLAGTRIGQRFRICLTAALSCQHSGWTSELLASLLRVQRPSDTTISVFLPEQEAEHGAWVAWSPDRKRVAHGYEDGSVSLLDLTKRRPRSELCGQHNDIVTSIAFSPDCKRFVSASDDGTIIIYSAATGAAQSDQLRSHSEGHPTTAAFSPDSTYIVSLSSDGTIQLWDAAIGRALYQDNQLAFEDMNSNGDRPPMPSVAFSPDGKRIVATLNKAVVIKEVQTGRTLLGPFVLPNGAPLITPVAFSPTGTSIALGTQGNNIQLWDVGEGSMVYRTRQTVPRGERNVSNRVLEDTIFSLAFSLDGERIATGSASGSVCIWDANTGQALSDPFHGHAHAVTSVAFLPDGGHVVSGAYDATIRIWDTSTPSVSFGDLASSPSSAQLAWNASRLFSDIGAVSWPSRYSPMIQRGWVVGPNQELLFWVPQNIRRVLLWPRNTAILGVSSAINLDLSKFVHGSEWTKCDSPKLLSAGSK